MNNIVIDEKRNVYLEDFSIKNSNELKPNYKRPLVLICPGGGYGYTSDREAQPIANSYNAQGYHALVLRYGTGDKGQMPGPIKDLAQSMKYIYDNNESLYIDLDNIFICGFSAGGHLAASLSTYCNDESILGEHVSKDYLNHKGIILGYPMLDLDLTSNKMYFGVDGYPEYEEIEFDFNNNILQPSDIFIRENNKTYANMAVIINSTMAGEYPSEDFINKYSITKNISNTNVPTFLWHGGNDGLVYPQNSIKMATNLYENNIECEIHIFRDGDHGLGLSNQITANNLWEINDACANWLNLSITWINNLIKTTK